jgi:hypothetical protein
MSEQRQEREALMARAKDCLRRSKIETIANSSELMGKTLPTYVLETTEKGKPTTRSKPFIQLGDL